MTPRPTHSRKPPLQLLFRGLLSVPQLLLQGLYPPDLPLNDAVHLALCKLAIAAVARVSGARLRCGLQRLGTLQRNKRCITTRIKNE